MLYATCSTYPILAHIIIELIQCCESVFDMNRPFELRSRVVEGPCCYNALNVMIQWMAHAVHIQEIQG